MLQFGIFRFKKKDLFFYAGGIAAVIGIYQYHFLMATIALICGIILKYKKSIWWSYLIMGSVGVYIIFLVKTFWLVA